MNTAKKVFFILFAMLLCSIPVSALAGTARSATADDTIPADAVSFREHSYKVYFDDMIGWHDAKAFCESLGGHLATVTSAEEDNFLYALVQGSACSYWLGGTDEENEGEWKWVSGEAWEYENASFDNCEGVQHYLTMNHHGSVWDDQSEKETSNNGDLCDTGGFICEWDYSASGISAADSDGDGLADEWEIFGADVNGDGTIDVDLPAMGADPAKKDIFVEVDWMVRPQKKFLFWETQSPRSMAPSDNAMYMVYEAFQNHNINLHIDAGADSTDFVTGARWGDLSGGNEIPYVDTFDLNNWGTTVQENLTEARSYIFRHCIFMDRFINPFNGGTSTSGIAAGIPGQCFIVSNQDAVFAGGDVSVGGTFMHELGHTLGLRHGGCDNTQYKPNYLSIMNYLFQNTGLVGTGALDYSNYELPDLDESDLSESLGIDPDGLTAEASLGTKWYHNGVLHTIDSIAHSETDFNCDHTIESGVAVDLNNGEGTVLYGGYNDWEHLIFKTGNIGVSYAYGNEYYKPADEYTQERTLEEALKTNTLANEGGGSVDCVTNALVPGAGAQVLHFDVYNRTSNTAMYTLELICPVLFADFSESLTVQGKGGEFASTRVTVQPYTSIPSGSYTVDCRLIYNEETVFEASFTIEVCEMTEQDEEMLLSAIVGGEIDGAGIDSSIVASIKAHYGVTHTHAYGEWKTVKEATESETGIKEKVCPCGHSITETIPKKATAPNDTNASGGFPTEAIVIISAAVGGILLTALCIFIFKKRRS